MSGQGDRRDAERGVRARHFARVVLAAVAAATAAPLLGAQVADSVATRAVAPGVTHQRLVRLAGPWVVNLLTVDLRRNDLALRHVRALDRLRGREKISAIAARLAATGAEVLAAVNADFFDLATGENENNQVVDGEWWKGVKVTGSPFDTFDNVHTQFALDALGRPLLDRFVFDGEVRGAAGAVPLLALNAARAPGPEGAVLFTARFGGATARDTANQVAEAPLLAAGRRADTLLYVRRGAVRASSGGAIPGGGAVLAGYGPRAARVAAFAEGETLAVVLGASPRTIGAAPLALLVGGWPRLLADGANVVERAASVEGTISRNAEVRHPRTAIGFSRDSTMLVLVTVDGRSARSAGMTLVELAGLMRELGAWQALNFDGGGSTTMVVRDAIVNTPSDPSGERSVGNALVLVRRAPR